VRNFSTQNHFLRHSPGCVKLIAKVDFERVPDLVERRRVFLREGKAYLPLSEQQSLIVAEFSNNLERALEVHVPRVRSLMS
jgi:DNA primase large subunit